MTNNQVNDDQQTPADVYGAVRDELIEALRTLDAAGAGTTVPACPTWTVKDVAAHLAGLNAQLLANVPGPLGSDEATARQVADRATVDLPAVLDEWSSMADAIHERFSNDPDRATALLADLVVHVYDLHEVLDQPTALAAAATPISARRYVPLLQQRVADISGAALTVELDGSLPIPGPLGDSLTAIAVRSSAHDFLRGVTGRLRRADVESFEWSADPSAILDHAWNQYGPFRT